MEDGSKQEKSIGSIPPIGKDTESASAPVESTDEKKASPVYQNVPTKDASSTSIPEVLPSEILAIQVMMGDFKEMKRLLAKSWQVSSKGKIYWCAEYTGHALSIENGNLLVDGQDANSVLNKLLEAVDEISLSTGE